MDVFAASRFYNFFNKYCSNFAEKSDGERVKINAKIKYVGMTEHLKKKVQKQEPVTNYHDKPKSKILHTAFRYHTELIPPHLKMPFSILKIGNFIHLVSIIFPCT